MARYLPAFLILLLLPAFQGHSADFYRFDPSSKQVFEDIYDLRFDRARDRVFANAQAQPANIVPAYLKAHLPFIRFLVCGNPTDRAEFERNLVLAKQRIDKGDEGSPWHYYLQASLNLQEAVLLYENGQLAQAGIGMRRAYNAYKDALDIDKDFLPALLEKNTLDILFASVPGEYEWVINVLGIKPDLEYSFGQVDRVMTRLSIDSTYRFISVPAFVMAGYMIRNFQKDASLQRSYISRIDAFLQRFPRYSSPLLGYIAAKMYQQLGENEEVLARLDGYAPSAGQAHMAYIYQLRGESYLRMLDAKAGPELLRFIKYYEGPDFRKETYRLLAWSAWIAGDTSQTRYYMKKVLTNGRLRLEADKSAQAEAQSSMLPNPHLLRVRLLFDGGYYEQALAELLGKKPGEVCRNHDEQVEYFYRLARIYDKTGRQDKALYFYDLVIGMGREMDAYYAANSAVLAGMICEEKGSDDKALSYYKACLDMPFKEYRKSIQARARAGIERLS